MSLFPAPVPRRRSEREISVRDVPYHFETRAAVFILCP